MNISFTDVPTKKPSLLDRLTAAYRAFTMTVHPDMAKVLDRLTEMQEEVNEKVLEDVAQFDTAAAKLDPFDKATIESIAARTANWHLLFDPTMKAIEDMLDVADQLIVIRFMFASNRHIVRQQAFRAWMGRHADAILDTLEREGH
jgi:hypothetical protein